ncbi:MAG: putative phage protein (TIGR02218 family) [Candidatus Midichloriaceae bacterium]|jgi:uncharacterized phage protein (TIGR02218 family)
MKKNNFLTEYAFCIEIILTNNIDIKLTNYHKDLKVDGKEYFSSIFSFFENNEDNFSCIIDDKHINKEYLINGLFNDAQINMILLNLQLNDNPIFFSKTYYIEDIQIINNKFHANLGSLVDKFNKKILQKFSKNCRAKFCDDKCSLDIKQYTKKGEVMEIIEHNIFIDSNRNEDANFFNNGNVIFTSGKNKDLTFSIKKSNVSEIELQQNSLLKLTKGDNYEIIMGCDKDFLTCGETFNNVINFRGEPHIYRLNNPL